MDELKNMVLPFGAIVSAQIMNGPILKNRGVAFVR
jgi:hypothetical protein